MNFKARRVEERWNFRVQSYLWLLWVPDFWSFLSYERSEDRVICDNGFGRNTTYWTFCYCFYSRILFNCRSVTLFMHVVYRWICNSTVAYKAISVAQIASPFFRNRQNSTDLSSERTLTFLIDGSVHAFHREENNGATCSCKCVKELFFFIC